MNRSKWTMIYWDLDPETGKLAPYIRLVPDFMDLEDAGYPHGLSLGGFRPDEADAKEFAKSVDRFMEALIRDHQETYPALPHVPAEYALVPMTATPEMIQAAEEVEDLYKLGTPQTWGKVYREMIAASPNQQPAKYPIQINPFITQYDEHVFVWVDETFLPRGVEQTAEDAKEALRKYGEQLETNPVSRAAQLIADWDSGHPAYNLSELGAEAVELLRIVLYNTPQKLDERETFEVWFKTLEAGLSLDGIKALHMAKEVFWQGWQARANK